MQQRVPKTKTERVSNDSAQQHETNTKKSIMQHYRTPDEILQSSMLPEWVKQYTEWHNTQRKIYLETIKNNSPVPDDIRFLISRCLSKDKCGGASDRLQDMPYNIMLANQTNRVLLSRWEKPWVNQKMRVKKWYGDGVVFGNQCFNCLRKLLSLFIYNHIKRWGYNNSFVNVLIICCGCTS